MHYEIVFANQRNYFFGEQLVTAISIYFGYQVALHSVVSVEMWIVLVY